VQHPRRFGIGRLIKTSGSVALRSYLHLSDDEREQIGVLRAAGRSIGAIALGLGRAKSTITRELRRNRLPSGRYSPLHAAGAYQLRRRREAAIEKDKVLQTFVRDRLAEGWTPEQISGWLKGGNERCLRGIGCETIYAFIYRAAQKAEQLWRYLTRRHKRRRPRRSRPSRDTIKDRVSIHERPKDIDARTEAGHWEGDLIICKRTRPVLVLHERKSRVTLAMRLAGKTAAETISVMLAVFARIEPALRKSITFDNDTAFAQHALLRTMRAMTTWFCDAYASWQKGGVENANGRLRRWLPRQIDIDQVSDEEIKDIVLTANLTPRKCLGFKTPFQAILKELGKDVQIRFS
jgi:transposase, IS30 family